jgi:hypothetical protein
MLKKVLQATEVIKVVSSWWSAATDSRQSILEPFVNSVNILNGERQTNGRFLRLHIGGGREGRGGA